MIISSEAVAEQETSAASHNPAVTAQEGLTAALGVEAQRPTPGMLEEHRAPEGAVLAARPLSDLQEEEALAAM